MTATLARTICKVDGCEEYAEDRTGRYAKLCATHKTEARTASAAGPRTTTRSTAAAKSGPATEAVKKLLPLAKALDRARSRIEQLPSNQQAKAAFDEAARRATQTPSPENLRRVTDAAKVLQKASPRRAKVEVELAEAERSYTLAVAALSATDERQ